MVRLMLRRFWILIALLFVPLAACGDGDGDSSSAGDGGEGGTAGVVVSGSGWTATFPGEVETASDPVPLPGGSGSTTAESTVWESDSEALNVVTSDFPPEIIEMLDAAMLLEGAAEGVGGVVDTGSSLLDADGTFRGREAIVYEASEDGITTNGLAVVDGPRLYQILHVSRDGDATAWETLLGTFEFSD